MYLLLLLLIAEWLYYCMHLLLTLGLSCNLVYYLTAPIHAALRCQPQLLRWLGKTQAVAALIAPTVCDVFNTECNHRADFLAWMQVPAVHRCAAAAAATGITAEDAEAAIWTVAATATD